MRSRPAGLALPAALCAPLLLLASPSSAAPAERVKYKAANSGAKIVAERRLGPLERDLTVSSPNLGGRVKVRILLPKSWTRDAKRTWPVLYVFHGGQDHYTSWTRNTDIEKWAAGYDAIVVMPEADNGSYTNWFNQGKGGVPRWETFHTKDVVQLMERNYHAGRSRAAIGVSAGGMGSLVYAARHPGLFKYVASLSGPVYLTGPGVPALTAVTMASSGIDVTDVYGDPSRNAANWNAHDPYRLAAKLRGVGIYLSSGTTGKAGPGDPEVGPLDVGLSGEEVLGVLNKEFDKRLKALRIAHTTNFYGDGRHNWPAWRRVSKKLFPKLMKEIGARRR